MTVASAPSAVPAGSAPPVPLPARSLGPSRHGHPTDCLLAALLTEAQRGREDAFTELYHRTRARVHAVVLRVLRSPELAGEVTQEAYLEIWQQRGRYQEERGSALGWMMMIARRRAVDRVRSVTRSVALERRYTEHNGALGEVDTWDEVTARLDAEQVRHCLPALSPVQRQALTLTYLEQRTAAEVARMLDVPLATMKSRIRDGRIRLRALVSEARHQRAVAGVAEPAR